jgi:iron complex transport system ATP-binding protein
MKRRYIASKIAVVPQELPENIPFTAGQVVEFGRIPYQPPWGNTTSVDIKKTVSAMKRMNVFHLASRKFNTLSGGEKQRVLISKALAQDTEIILLDEPSSHLDISANIAAFKVLKELASAGKAVIAVCHDIVISPVFIDHAFLMGNSGIIAEGPPEKIFTEKNIEKTYGIKAGLEFSGKSKISLKLDL